MFAVANNIFTFANIVDKIMSMKITYNKLWKLLIDKGLNKTDLRKMACISTATLAKLSKDETVSTEVLLKICQTLNCNLEDIVETVQG